jgi:hypothetical protein
MPGRSGSRPKPPRFSISSTLLVLPNVMPLRARGYVFIAPSKLPSEGRRGELVQRCKPAHPRALAFSNLSFFFRTRQAYKSHPAASLVGARRRLADLGHHQVPDSRVTQLFRGTGQGNADNLAGKRPASRCPFHYGMLSSTALSRFGCGAPSSRAL